MAELVAQLPRVDRIDGYETSQLAELHRLMRDQAFVRRCFGNAACLLTAALMEEHLEQRLPLRGLWLLGEFCLIPPLLLRQQPQTYVHDSVSDASTLRRRREDGVLVLERMVQGVITMSTELFVEAATNLIVERLHNGINLPVYIFMAGVR